MLERKLKEAIVGGVEEASGEGSELLSVRINLDAGAVVGGP